NSITGIPQTRTSKRGVLTFGLIVACETKRNALEYNGYGCYCGQGGEGTPVDEIDCVHNVGVFAVFANLNIMFSFFPIVVGSPWNSCVQKKLCECDAEAAKCFKKYDSKFNENHKNYPKSTFSSGLPTSQVGYHAGKPIESFANMIQCSTNRSMWDYYDYGCWCGFGGSGSGQPVDGTDRCCYAHDMCYRKLQQKEACGKSYRIVQLYLTPYLRKGCSGCVGRPWNSCFQKKLCECDAEAAKCFKKYDSKFNENHKNFPKSTCK
ncbi:unnamed protein product, partial [Porites lobata]